jgi:hypothetical protein
MESLRKLWDGFCYPSAEEIMKEEIQEVRTRAPRCSKEIDLVRTHARQSLSDEFPAAAPTADLIPDTQKERTDIVATNQGRRKRVIRGLEVALVALFAVFATLYTLHRWGYVADLQLTKSNNNSSHRAGRQSKPLIKIHENLKVDSSHRTRHR